MRNRRLSEVAFPAWGPIVSLAGFLILIGFSSLLAQSNLVFDMEDFSTQELRALEFSLNSSADLEIYIVGARHRSSDQLYALGWILDSESREIAWSMEEANTRRFEDDRNLRMFDGTICLDKGKYEAYYYAGSPLIILKSNNIDKDVDNIEDLIKLLEGTIDAKLINDMGEYINLMKKFRFKLYSDSKDFIISDLKTPSLPNQIISITQPRNLSEARKAFKLQSNMDIIVYAIGEYSEKADVFMDGARIIDAKTRQKVWAMERWNTDWAGGALKNRCFHNDISLPAGEYILQYWTDDSHTYDDWSGSPPYDPFFYGITLCAESAADRSKISPSDIEQRKRALVQIIKVEDDADLAREFKLKQAVKVNVYAIGEGEKGYMYDYGWIENADNDEIIWKMKEEETDHAGGALKNRLFDGIIELPAGNYRLRYKTDGSHSFGSWNEPQPSDPRHYGITLYSYDEDFNPDLIEVGELKSLKPESSEQAVQYYLKLGDIPELHVMIPNIPDAPLPGKDLIILNKEFKEKMLALQLQYKQQMMELQEEQLEDPDYYDDVREFEEQMKELQQDFTEQMQELVDDYQNELVDLQEQYEEEQTDLIVAPPAGEGNVLARINQVGNDSRMKSIFSLEQPTRVRIYALGEGADGRMFDYGWIVNKKTGSVIWEMTYRKTRHAGGATKNRLIDDVIMLDRGEYDVYYVTDDSHSYPNWNASPPSDQMSWGITIKIEDGN